MMMMIQLQQKKTTRKPMVCFKNNVQNQQVSTPIAITFLPRPDMSSKELMESRASPALAARPVRRGIRT